MARPRKPTAILELSGAFRKDPQRRRPNEPKETRPLGDPPGRLPANVVSYWRELVEMVPSGVLTFADRWTVEIAAKLMEKFNREQSAETILELASIGDLNAASIKELIDRERITSAEQNNLIKALGSMGLDPASRSKLSIAKDDKKENRFARQAAEVQAIR